MDRAAGLPTGPAPNGVRRLVYKQLLPGDYRKLKAESNDANTGGGARDLRFPFSAFEDIFRRLLPSERTERRRRNGQRVDLHVRAGTVYIDEVDEHGTVTATRTEEMVWESATDARSAEGRITKVHAGAATADLLEARDDVKGEAFALFVQDDNGELRVHYAFESELRDGSWADAVAQPILDHLDGPRRADRAVTGYIDYLESFRYAHGTR